MRALFTAHFLFWPGTIEHQDLNREFDCRQPQTLSKKRYLQALLTLEQRLVANPRILSAQPISYYKLILRDVCVEPDLGDFAYQK